MSSSEPTVAARMHRSVAASACVVAALLAGWAIVSDLTLKAAFESGDVSDARRAVVWNPFDATAMLTASTADLRADRLLR